MVSKLIEEGKIRPVIGYYLTRVNLSEVFGWTPQQMDEMTAEELAIYSAIMSGKGETKGVPDRVMKKVLH